MKIVLQTWRNNVSTFNRKVFFCAMFWTTHYVTRHKINVTNRIVGDPMHIERSKWCFAMSSQCNYWLYKAHILKLRNDFWSIVLAINFVKFYPRGAVTLGNFSCNLSCNFVVRQVARKIPQYNIPWNGHVVATKHCEK